MSQPISDEEYNRVLGLPAADLYGYFTHKVARSKTLWSLSDGEGFVLLTDDEGAKHLPVWPDERFAGACVPEGFPIKPAPIPLLSWAEKWIPALLEENRMIAVFPTPTGSGVSVPPQRLREDMEEELRRLHSPGEPQGSDDE